MRSIPPHLWKLNDVGELVGLTLPEQKIRLAHIAKYGLDNSVKKQRINWREILSVLKTIADVIILIFVGIFSYRYFKS